MKNIKNIILFIVLHLTLWVNGQTCFEVLKNDFKAADATQDFKNFVGSDPDALYIYASLSIASKSVRTDINVLQFYKKLTNSNLDAFGTQLIQKLDDVKLKSFANDFKNADVADLNKLAANNGALVDVWYSIYKSNNIEVLESAKRLKNKSYIYSGTQNDGLLFEDDLAKILVDKQKTIISKGKDIYDPSTNIKLGEIDIETDLYLFECGIGNTSKKNQAVKYTETFPQLFNPNNKTVVFYLPNYGNNVNKNKEITDRGCVLIKDFEDFLNLF